MKNHILTLIIAFSSSLWASNIMEERILETNQDVISDIYGNVFPIYESNSSIYEGRVFNIHGEYDSPFYPEYVQRFEPVYPLKEMQPVEEPSTPYTPFPWPCDELQQDCADLDTLGIIKPVEEPSTPYTPFPWPCDEFQQDCADTLNVQ